VPVLLVFAARPMHVHQLHPHPLSQHQLHLSGLWMNTEVEKAEGSKAEHLTSGNFSEEKRSLEHLRNMKVHGPLKT
jgi:hypothetical protein